MEKANVRLDGTTFLVLFAFDNTVYVLFCVCYCMRHAKEHGKQADISEFRAQLDALGLKIIQATVDGNCFFRLFSFKRVCSN
ncbi:hypothetical protein H5410_060677 [Solanum commersonii]|uniref:OTU domain-containing protein n=1 Tax=Solanum commersonii TaxID=4109 RepID=A0A9J5W6D0_SOLCO|nr:hypothetical protein H5410_060677 [Solanum commersonii]